MPCTRHCPCIITRPNPELPTPFRDWPHLLAGLSNLSFIQLSHVRLCLITPSAGTAWYVNRWVEGQGTAADNSRLQHSAGNSNSNKQLLACCCTMANFKLLRVSHALG